MFRSCIVLLRQQANFTRKGRLVAVQFTTMSQNQKSIMSFFASKSSATPSPFNNLKDSTSPKPHSSKAKSPDVLKERPPTKNSKARHSGKSKRPTEKEEQIEATVSQVKKVRISDDVKEVTCSPPSKDSPANSSIMKVTSPDSSPIKPGKRRRVQILESDESGSDTENQITSPVIKTVVTSPTSDDGDNASFSTPPVAPASIPKRKTAKLSKEFRSKLVNRIQTPHTSKVKSEVNEDLSSPEEAEPSPTSTGARPSPIASKLSSFAYKKRGMSSQKSIDECKAEAEDDVDDMDTSNHTEGEKHVPDVSGTPAESSKTSPSDKKSTFPKGSPSPKSTPLQKKSGSLTSKGKGKLPVKKSSKKQASVKKEESVDSNSDGEDKSVEKASKLSSSLVSASDDGSYNPRKDKYEPIKDACWKSGEDVPYKAVSDTLKAIEETSARLQKTLILSNFLRSVCILTPDDLHLCVYLCTNQVAPAYEGIELGVGETVVMKAIHEACGVNIAAQKAKLKKMADLGLVAEASRAKQKLMFKPKPLSVKSVFKTLLDMTAISGNQGQGQKVGLIKKLLVSCQGSEARFITRSMLGKLRCGLAEQTVLVALGHAVVQTPPAGDTENAVASKDLVSRKDTAADIVKTCYCEFPNFEHIIKMIRQHGVAECQQYCKLSPGVPVKPMLAHPTKGVSEVLQRFEGCEFSCEFKYDGERAQIQCSETGEMRIFSRNQENNTGKYPDIIARIGSCLVESTQSFILDCEVVAWDVEEKKILPFQILTTRKRKDADINEIKVKVCLFAFDLLYLNGESLIRKPFRERRQNLHAAFKEVEGEFVFASARDCNDTEEIQEFLDESIKNQCEGLMVKTLDKDATYEIAKRSHNWLKVKKDYLEGCGDSLDLAVIGAFQGKGKRSGAFGGFLLACYDPDTEQFQAICKLGTGLTDEDLATQHKALSEHIIDSPKSYYSYPETNAPEVWFEPSIVWEVKCADMTISPIYTAAMGLVDPVKGISLRFPRFIRVRDDKTAEDATSAEQVAELYQKQDNKQEQSKPTEDDEY